MIEKISHWAAVLRWRDATGSARVDDVLPRGFVKCATCGARYPLGGAHGCKVVPK